MRLPRSIKMLLICTAVSILVLAVMSEVLAFFSIHEYLAWFIYLPGCVLVFLAFLKRNVSHKSETQLQEAGHSNPQVDTKSLRERVRAMKQKRRHD